MEKLVMTPGPTNVPERVLRAMSRQMINHRSPDFSTLYAGIKERAQRVFETGGEIIVLTGSSTAGVQASVRNLIGKGDKAVVPVFGEFSERLAESIRLSGGEAIAVRSAAGSAPDPEQVEAAMESARGVKALYLVYNETSTGVTYRWIRETSEMCSRYGAYLVVDAVSILGGDELPVDKLGVDICVTGSQKCLAAPPGLAILSISDRAKKFIMENPPSDQYLDLSRYFRYGQRGETPFTPALPLFFALGEALQMILEEGMQARIRRHKICADAFYSSLGAMGLGYFAEERVRSNTVLAFNYPRGIEDNRFRSILDEKFGVQIAGGFGEFLGRMLRVGSMGAIDSYHVLSTVTAMASCFNVLEYAVDTAKVVRVAIDKLKAMG